MKNLLTHFSKIRGYFSASQCNDVGYDCRLTVVRPSFDCRSTMLKFCSVLAILFIVGVGYAWGAEEVMYPSNGSTFNSGWNKTSRTARQTYAASTAAIQLMGESSGTYGEISSKSTYTGITAISVKATASGSKDLILYYSSNGSSWTEVSTKSISKNTSAYDKYDLTITGIPSSAVYIKFRAGSSSVYIYSVTVTTGGSSVATPTFSPAAGTYTSAQSVTISCATAGSTIYYTTDGTTPTSSSTVYSSAVSISSSCTLKAIAKKGSDYSSVASASYTINIPYTVSFSTGTGNPTVDDVTEESQGEGIELPDGVTPDCSSDGWVFAGWSATEYTSVPEATSVGRLYMPGDSYYPEDDETLYAVYRKLTSGKSTATFTASTRTGLTQISSGLTSPGWWYHTASGVEFYIKSYGYSSTYSSFDIWKSWALIDAHTKIDKVVFTNYSTYTISSVELNDDEEDAGGSASLTGTTTQTITCSGDVTQLYLYSPGSGDSYFTEFTVTYYNAKFSSNPTCASCDANPIVGAASLNGTITLSTQMTAQCSSGISNIGGEGCTISSYGFAVGTATGPTIGNTLTTGGATYEVGSTYTTKDVAFEKLITGLSASTKYYARAYATNGHGTGYGDEFSFTMPAACSAAPTVTAATTGTITSTTAVLNCSSGISALGTGGCAIESYGFVIGTASDPAIGGSGVTQHEVGTTYTTTGTSFTKTISSGLTEGTLYYVRPYATNGYSTGYGTQVSFGTPKITISETSRAFGDKAIGGSYTMTFTVEGSYLQSDISIAKSGTNQSLFSIDKSSVSQTSGTAAETTITVTYSPTTAGSHTATLTLTSTNATSKTVSLSGTGKWTVTFLDADGAEHSTALVANGSAPSKPGSDPTTCDATSTTFMGWTQTKWNGKISQDDVDDLTTAATKVYFSGDDLPTMSDDMTYYPVFAKRSGSETEKTININTDTLTSYASVNKTIGGITFKSTGKYGKNTWSSYEYVQCENGKVLYNDDAIPGYIKSVKITPQSPAGVTNHVQLAVGTTKQPTSYSEDITTETTFGTYTSSNGYTYMAIYANGASALANIQIKYMKSSYTYSDYLTTCCEKKVALSVGSLSHCSSMSIDNTNLATCSSTDVDRQVTITVTPDAGYEMLDADGLEFSKSSGTVTASYVSGPTGSGPYTFVYQFAQNDNGSGVFNATCTPKTYRITFDQTGATTQGTEYVDVVFNSALPAIASLPEKTDYNFAGYWTQAVGGTQFVGPTGTWYTVTNWINSDKQWINTSNKTLYPHWTEKSLQNYRTECPSFEVYNQDGTSEADIHLTSTKDVEIYASEAAGNLIRIIASGLDANGDHPKIGVEYYDANNGDALVTGTDRVFRLSNSSTYDYENDLLDLGENTTEYDQTFSICYVPKDYNQSHHYKLKLILRNNNTEKDNVTIDLYGRSLPKEFVIAAKSGDTWYALPNTLAATEGGQGAISPTAITVDNATTPTKVVNPVGTVIYGACNKYTNANRSGLRFTSDGAHWIQTSSTASAYKMWLSNTGYTNAQDWYLKSTDLSAYEVFMDPIGSPSDKRRIELYNSSGVKMGYHNTGATDARTGVGNVYLLPVEFPSITARIMEWGTDHVVVELRTPGSSTKVKTQIGGGAIGDEQSLESVKKDEGVYRLAVSLSSSDALKDLKLYFYNISDVLQGVAAFTIPRIVSSTTTTGSFGTPFKKDAPFVDLVILNGATLTVSETTDGTKFTFRDLYVYGNAKMVVPSGTYIDFSNVYLRGGHLDASWSYVYSHPQLVLNGTMGNTSNTINYDYLTNNAQFYSLALPYDVTLSTIVNPDFNNKQSWLIHAYDGALRASGSQVSGWYDVEEGSTEGDIDPLGSSDALTAGVGYTFFGAPQKVNSIRQKWSVNRFPMTLASGSAEVAKSGVSVTAHGMTESAGVYTLNDGVAPNDAGWNMLGNPFLADIGGTETYETAVKGTILSYHNVKTMDASGNWTGGWHWEENETNVRYVRIPNDLGTEYEQVRFKDATLRAFHHFFIQAGATGTFNFDLATRAQSMPQRIKRGKLLLPEEMDVDFRLSKEEASTKFGLTLCDDFSSDYVMNEDIAEDLSGEAMKAYTMILDQRVTYNGLPFTAAQQIIPVGFRAPNAGEYTFSYQEDENSENIEHIYLTDMRLGVVTDLKDNTYKFASEIGVVDNRFVLQIVFSSNVITDVEETFEQENGRPLKFLYQGKIYILRNGILYDITGKRVREINK